MSIVVYTKTRCKSSTQAMNWLNEHNIIFTERKIEKNEIAMEDFNHILQLTMKGTEDIISQRSLKYLQLKKVFNDLTLQELRNLVYQYPSLLRTPIIVSEEKILIGFSAVDIRIFIPREVRRKDQHKILLSQLENL